VLFTVAELLVCYSYGADNNQHQYMTRAVLQIAKLVCRKSYLAWWHSGELTHPMATLSKDLWYFYRHLASKKYSQTLSTCCSLASMHIKQTSQYSNAKCLFRWRFFPRNPQFLSGIFHVLHCQLKDVFTFIFGIIHAQLEYNVHAKQQHSCSRVHTHTNTQYVCRQTSRPAVKKTRILPFLNKLTGRDKT